MAFKHKIGIVWSVLALTVCVAGYYGVGALRQHLQMKFREMHAFISEPDDYTDNQSDESFQKSDSVTTPLQTQSDAVSWAVLKQAKLLPVPNDPDFRMIPKYTPDIKDLNGEKEIVEGYMFPLDPNNKQSHFLMSPYPVSCPYCYPAGATELVEVFSKNPVTFTYAPISLTGKFKVLTTSDEIKDGILYQISDARVNGK